jgi:hypothetical protein
MSDDLAHRRDRLLKAEPDTRATNRSVVSVRDTPHAPIVFFEWAPASGCANGIVSVTLGANCNTQVRPNGEVMSEMLVVAHLRCSVQAALNLRRALDNALSLAVRGRVPKGKTN